MTLKKPSFLCLLAFLAIAGCTPREDDPRRAAEWGECTRNSECPQQQICRNRKCVPMPPAPPAASLKPPEGMVHVPAGEFTMGSNRGILLERPQVEARTADFFIDIHEVTAGEYARCVAAGHCPEPACVLPEDDVQLPVRCVSHAAAAAYCAFAGKRLPTEEEWEKAARGIDARTYPWGENAPDCKRAVFAGCGDGPAPVGGRPEGQSPYGTQDQAGNVWEWTATSRPPWDKENDPKRLQAGHDSPPPGQTQAGKPSRPQTPHFIIRGGSYLDSPLSIRPTLRFLLPETFVSRALGFRCAVDPPSR